MDHLRMTKIEVEGQLGSSLDDCKRNCIEAAVSEEVDVKLTFNNEVYEVKFSELMELVKKEKDNE